MKGTIINAQASDWKIRIVLQHPANYRPHPTIYEAICKELPEGGVVFRKGSTSMAIGYVAETTSYLSARRKAEDVARLLMVLAGLYQQPLVTVTEDGGWR